VKISVYLDLEGDGGGQKSLLTSYLKEMNVVKGRDCLTSSLRDMKEVKGRRT